MTYKQLLKVLSDDVGRTVKGVVVTPPNTSGGSLPRCSRCSTRLPKDRLVLLIEDAVSEPVCIDRVACHTRRLVFLKVQEQREVEREAAVVAAVNVRKS